MTDIDFDGTKITYVVIVEGLTPESFSITYVDRVTPIRTATKKYLGFGPDAESQIEFSARRFMKEALPDLKMAVRVKCEESA